MWDHMSVFEKSAMKLVSQFILTRQIHASNEYLRAFKGQETSVFHNGSDGNLAEEQYGMVKHVGLNFISCLLFSMISNVQLNVCGYLLLG
jgi:hypothetical protein